MNARELLQLLGIETNKEVNLLTIAQLLEDKVSGDDAKENDTSTIPLFDQDTIDSFNSSKDDNGRYHILPEDLEVIKCAKSIINLLRDMNEALPVVKPAVQVVNSQGWFGYTKNMVSLTVAGTIAGAKAMVFGSNATYIGNDLEQFRYHLAQLKHVLVKLPAVQKNLQTVVSDISSSMPAAIFNKVRDTRKQQVKDRTTARVGYVDVAQLSGYVTSLCKHLKGDDDMTVRLRHLKGKILTTLKEIEKFQNDNAGKEITWDLVSDEYKSYYSSLLKDLKFLGRNFPNKNAYKSYIKPITNWRHYNDTALGIKHMPGKINVYDGLDLVIAGLNTQIPDNIRQRYLDEATKLYSGYANDDNLAETTKYAMMAANHATKAKEIFRRIYFLNQLPLVEKAASLVEILNQTGDILNEIVALHPDGSMKKNLEGVLQEIYVALIPVYKEMVKTTCQTEVTMGFEDNALISKLKPVADRFEAVARLYKMNIELDYPFEKQKLKAIDHAITKLSQERDNLEISVAAFSAVKIKRIDLSDLLLAEKVAKQIVTFESHTLQKHIDKLLQKVCGLDKLNKKIRKLEAYVNHSVDVEKIKIDENMENVLHELRDLYRDKSLIEAALKSARENSDDSVNLNIYWDNGIKTVGMEQRLKAMLGQASKNEFTKECAALMDAAMNMRENIKVRLLKLHVTKKRYAENVYQPRKAKKTTDNASVNAAAHHETVPVDNVELINKIVARQNGPLITTVSQTRKKLIELSKQYLAEDQFAQLQRKNSFTHLCEASNGDGLLTACIKRSSNIMYLVEDIASKMNKVRACMDTGSYFDALRVFSLSGDCRLLINELKLLKQSLQVLNGAFDNNAISVAQTKLKSLMGLMTNIPYYIDIATRILPEDAVSVVAPDIVQELKEVVSESQAIAAEIAAVDGAVEMKNMGKTVKADESLGMIAAFYKKFVDEFERHRAPLLSQIPADTEMKDGFYLTDEMHTGKEVAILMNVGGYLKEALRAATDISKGDTLSGIIDALSAHKKMSDELLKLRSTGDDEHDEKVEGLLRYLTGKYLDVSNIIKQKYKVCYAYAALSEKMLGLGEGVLTHKFKGIVDALIEGADEYQHYQFRNVYYNIEVGALIEAANFDEIRENMPFFTTQLTIAEDELTRLLKNSANNTPAAISQLTRMAELTNTLRANESLRPERWAPVPDLEAEFLEAKHEDAAKYKVSELRKVCDDYMWDLTDICFEYLRKLNRDKYDDYIRRNQKLLNDPNGLDDIITSMLKLDFGAKGNKHVIHDLNKAKEKLIAVREMNSTLITNEKSVTKLINFREQFNSHVPRLDDGTDHFTRFIKLVLDIFRYGIKTSFGMWRTHDLSPGLVSALNVEPPKSRPER